jgi:tRNA-specific adenosine deaminase 3
MALVHSRVKEIFYIYPMSQTGGCGGRTIVSELPTINHRFNIWQWKEETLQLLGSDIGYIPAIPATVHV